MKLSLLGCNGFLSTAIAKYANMRGWTLNMYGLEEPRGCTFDRFVRCNLMDSVLDCAQLLESDVIVYAIGAGIQSSLKESSHLIYTLNVSAPVTICNSLKELNYNGSFVTFGSVFEMGETKDEKLFVEDDIISSTAPSPSDYVVSKRMLTRFVTSYKHQYTHWHFVIPTIYGPGENPKRLIPYTINAIRRGEELHFTAGNQVRQYIFVNEIPKVLELAFNKRLPSGLYNIEGKETLTVKEIVRLIHLEFGSTVPKSCFGTDYRNDVGMKYLALDGTKLRSFIPFNASVRIKDVIRMY